jgi:DNA-binding NarL/FixJ family response regulator
VAFGVVIVDDNPLFLETARDLLEREGLRVVGLAATAAQALQRTAELRPDIVLVDISLGDESGFDVARRLAEHDRIGGTAVILISTHSEADFADLIAESLRRNSCRRRICRRTRSAGSSTAASRAPRRALASPETRRPAWLGW